MSQNEIVIQEINLLIIKKFLNDLKSETWFKQDEIEVSNQNLNLIWNIMYLYNNGYIISSFLDEEVPVIYTSRTQMPTKSDQKDFYPVNSAVQLFNQRFGQDNKPELDLISLQKMEEYSKNRKYIKGYYCKYRGNELVKFYYFYPLLTEAGVKLRELLNETNKEKRKKALTALMKIGGRVIEVIAPLLTLMSNF